MTYGRGTFKGIEFGLYGYEDIDSEETMDNIKREFEDQYLKQIKTNLKKVGIKFISLKWFSPREYNFANDNLDLTIRIVDKKKIKTAILKHKTEIDKRLSENKSYSGYTSLTIYSVESELELLDKPNYEIDLIVLSEILNIDFTDFDINEHLITLPDCEECNEYFDQEDLKEFEGEWLCEDCLKKAKEFEK